MKKIIDNMLYDTDKAEKIFSYRSRRIVVKGVLGSDMNIYGWYKTDIYRTAKGNYFQYGYRENTFPLDEFLEKMTEEVMKIIKELSPEKYISFNFEVIEEA